MDASVSTRYDTVDPIVLPSGNNLFKRHKEVLYLQAMISPERVDIFPPDWGMLRRSRCVQIFLLKPPELSILHSVREEMRSLRLIVA